MAHVKQGEFKKIREEHKNLKISYDKSRQHYDEIEEEGKGYEFSEEMFTLEDLYVEADDLVISISSLLRYEKFEDNKKEGEYKDMLENSKSIKQYAFDKFSDIAYCYRSVGLSDSEQEALNGTAIGRDYCSKNNYHF